MRPVDQLSVIENYQMMSGYAEFPQKHRSAGSLPISFVRAEQRAHDLVDPAVPEITLALGLDADTPFRWDLGDGWTGKRFRTGDMNLVPPNTETAFECGDDHELLVLIHARRRDRIDPSSARPAARSRRSTRSATAAPSATSASAPPPWRCGTRASATTPPPA